MALRLDALAVGFGVAGMQVEPVGPRDQLERLVQVGALVRGPGSAGVIPGDRQPATDRLARVLEPDDVVALPAVQRDRDLRQSLQGASTSTPNSSYRSFAASDAASTDRALIAMVACTLVFVRKRGLRWEWASGLPRVTPSRYLKGCAR